MAFCVRIDQTVTQSKVLDECRKWLPSFMVPADVLVLNELPYLDSGKTDRKALQALWLESRPYVNGQEEDMSPRLRSIITVASNVLQATITAQTRLSSVGLDSLTAIRLASELRKADLPRPSATDLMSSSTVKDIEILIGRLEKSQDDSHQPDFVGKQISDSARASALVAADVRQNEVDDIFVASPTQAYMLAETMRSSHAYCNTIELEITGSFTTEDIGLSLRKLANIHPLLRAGFIPIEGNAVTHAVVVWKELQGSQIQHVSEPDRGFSISCEQDLLHPCSFQVVAQQSGIRITILIHHALYDQWSMDVFRSDLGMLLMGHELAPRPSFGNVAALYHNNGETSQYRIDMDFWSNYFKDFSSSRFPDISGKEIPGQIKRTPRRTLNVSLSELKHMSRGTGLTPATIFQTAVAYLFSSMTGTPEVTFGVVHSGRHLPIPGIESILGPCLNTLPLQLDLATTRTCSELMRLVHSTNQSLRSHALTPLSAIKSSLPDLREATLFDSLFIWQESIYDDDQDVVKEIDTADHHEFNFVLELFPKGDQVDAKVTYRDDLVTEVQVEVFLQQLSTVVQHIARSPGSKVENLNQCLHPHLLSISNAQPLTLSDGCNLLAPLERFAYEQPTAPAVIFADGFDDGQGSLRALSYRDFHQQSNALAGYFRSVGIVPGTLVCICMEKSPDLYVAIIATIKAGAGYLPLVPETPRERIRSILEQTAVRFCVCDSDTAGNFNALESVTAVDVTILSLASQERLDPSILIENNNTAYTCFTSGSTGRPKGVAVTVQNLVGNLEALQELYQTKPGDRMLQACSQAFDVSVFEIFFAFYTGMTLCSARKDVLFQDFESSIQALNISHLSLTPTVAALVKPANVPMVKFLVTAGEGITPRVHREWAGRGLHQGYGPSETTNICTVNMEIGLNDALGSIGKPLRNTSAFVISPGKRFEILPVGALGEFAFGGEQVFRGYVGRADLNEEKIIDHPEFGRIYRSGDLGRLLPDGSLLITGRIDDQVKVRGNRVELGEINTQLLKDSDVLDCTTLLVGQSSAEQTLVSYVVTMIASSVDKGKALLSQAVDEALLRRLFESLGSSLPLYMIPAKIVPVTHLPLTSQGKLDRRLLQSILDNLDPGTSQQLSFQTERSEQSDHWTDIEHQIARVLAYTLGIPETTVARNTSFFAVGLNSLTAISFARALTKELRVNVKASSILQQRTISRLALNITRHNRTSRLTNGHLSPAPLIPRHLVQAVRSSWNGAIGTIQDVLPCTSLQAAMLSASASGTQSSYCNTTVFRIHGDISRIMQCWVEVIKRHDILRASFVITDDKANPYVQVVLDERQQSVIENYDYYRDSSTMLGCVGGSSTPDRLNPFRIVLSTDEKTSRLTLHMHHAIYDGVSMSLLLREIEDLYHCKVVRHPTPVAPFLMEVQRHDTEEALAFWSAHVSGFHAKPFQSSHARSNSTLSVRHELPFPSIGITSFCKKYSVSELAIFQTGLTKALAYLQSSDDICFGNVVSGRTVPVDDIDSLVSPCFNTIPVRIDLRSLHSNLDLVLSLNAYNIDALNYQLTPLPKIQALSKTPELHLFDALLLVQPPEVELDRQIWTAIEDTGTMDLPLVIEIIPQLDHYALSLHTQTMYLSEESSNELLELFTRSMSSVLQFANGAIDHFEEKETRSMAGILAPAEQHSSTAPPAMDAVLDPAEETIREVFASLARVDKDAIGRQTSMYQLGLDSLNAAQVAARLRTLGLNVDAADVMEATNPQALAALASVRDLSTPMGSGIDFHVFQHRHLPTVLQGCRLPRSSLEMIRPCTAVQSGLIAQSVQSEGRLYVNHIALEVPPSVTADDIRSAWSAVMKRHQVLRMGFHQVQDPSFSHAMSIIRFESAHLPIVDVSDHQTTESIEYQATRQIMDLLTTRGWMVTTQLSTERRMIVLSIHHGLYDADGLQAILSDLSKAITGMALNPGRSIDGRLTELLTAALEGREAGRTFWKDALHQTT